MNRAGFVLVGGNSSRMGRDKALLPYRGRTLAAHIAGEVAAAAGSVALIGDPAKYGHLGYPVLPDVRSGVGPAGGIETALIHSAADWNLVLACDMPSVSADFLRSLLDAAEIFPCDALLPVGPTGRREPLCAVYHKSCAVALRAALDAGINKVTAALDELRVTAWPAVDAPCFVNLNTPEEWARYDAP